MQNDMAKRCKSALKWCRMTTHNCKRTTKIQLQPKSRRYTDTNSFSWFKQSSNNETQSNLKKKKKKNATQLCVLQLAPKKWHIYILYVYMQKHYKEIKPLHNTTTLSLVSWMWDCFPMSVPVFSSLLCPCLLFALQYKVRRGKKIS